MSEITEALKQRTMRFAVDVCQLIRQLPTIEPGPTAGRQLARSATGIAFNYRSTCRARSHAEFTARLAIVAEEADETFGWLEFIEAAGLASSSEHLKRLVTESNALVAIFSASLRTARSRARARKR